MDLEMFFDSSEDTATPQVNALELAISNASMAMWLDATANTYIQSRAAQRFASEGDDISGPWAPLSPATVANRIAEGYPGANPILHRTGELEQYITKSNGTITDTGADVTLQTPGPPSGELAVKVQTAQKGKGRTPARPIMGINETDVEVLLISLSTHITEAIGGGLGLL